METESGRNAFCGHGGGCVREKDARCGPYVAKAAEVGGQVLMGAAGSADEEVVWRTGNGGRGEGAG